MSGRTHRELAVGSHLISERWKEGEKETKAGKTKDRERERDWRPGGGPELVSHGAPWVTTSMSDPEQGLLLCPAGVSSEPLILLLASSGGPSVLMP